jgi:alkylhydroperoxidase family enzyme
MPKLIEPARDAIPPEIAALLDTLPPDPMFKTLAHAPSTLAPMLQFARSLYEGLELPTRLREIAILTLAAATSASFVWTQHVPISQTAGIDDDARNAIQEGSLDSPALTSPDRAVATFAAALAAGPSISEELFETVRAQLSEREFVELLQVLGYYWMLSRISTALEIEPTESYETYRNTFLND